MVLSTKDVILCVLLPAVYVRISRNDKEAQPIVDLIIPGCILWVWLKALWMCLVNLAKRSYSLKEFRLVFGCLCCLSGLVVGFLEFVHEDKSKRVKVPLYKLLAGMLMIRIHSGKFVEDINSGRGIIHQLYPPRDDGPTNGSGNGGTPPDNGPGNGREPPEDGPGNGGTPPDNGPGNGRQPPPPPPPPPLPPSINQPRFQMYPLFQAFMSSLILRDQQRCPIPIPPFPSSILTLFQRPQLPRQLSVEPHVPPTEPHTLLPVDPIQPLEPPAVLPPVAPPVPPLSAYAPEFVPLALRSTLDPDAPEYVPLALR